MLFPTKIARVIASELEPWRKLNAAAFLASGIAANHAGCIGALALVGWSVIHL